jgi:hypothetical protein
VCPRLEDAKRGNTRPHRSRDDLVWLYEARNVHMYREHFCRYLLELAHLHAARPLKFPAIPPACATVLVTAPRRERQVERKIGTKQSHKRSYSTFCSSRGKTQPKRRVGDHVGVGSRGRTGDVMGLEEPEGRGSGSSAGVLTVGGY